MTKVSVLMPIYNTNTLYLKAAVESVLNQTFSDFELLILNDSPDNQELKKIIGSYDDKRIFYMENTCNIGISASRNKLLKAARGQYVAIMDHDDISLPGRLEKQALYLDLHPDTGVVGCNIRRIGTKITSDFPVDNQSVKSALPDGCVIAHTAAMIRKSVLIDNRISWENDFSPCEDYMLWIRLAGKTLFHNLPEILVEYRYYPENTSHLRAEKMIEQTARIQYLAKKKYPYLSGCSFPVVRWIYLFSFIPLVKIKKRKRSVSFFLFGLIPVLKYKRAA